MAAKKTQRKPKAMKRKKKVSVPAPPKISSPPSPPITVPSDLPINKPAEGDTTQFLRREAERMDGDSAIRLYLREIGQVKLLTLLYYITAARNSRN